MENIESVSLRIAELRRRIERAAKLYYENDAPEISDFEYVKDFHDLNSN